MNDMKSIRFPPPVADEMIRAILEGRKTVTRREVRPQPREIHHGGTLFDYKGDLIALGERQNGMLGQSVAPYRPGNILYVREKWQYAYELDGNDQAIEGTGRYLYAADENNPSFGYWVMPDGTRRDSMPWRPSIHMPREAARLFLRVTDVRVERLQDITKEQAFSEGVPDDSDYPLDKPVYCPKCKGEGIIGAIHPESLGYMETDCPYCDTPQKRFSHLWDSTIKKTADRALYGWAANPWVWVITFELCGKPEEDTPC